MNYLAHFSTEGGDDRTGSFTMLVSASNINEAVDRLKQGILDIKKAQDILTGITKVFIDVIIQINRIPKEAVITYYESRSKDGLSRICISPVDGDSLQSAHWHPDDEIGPDFSEQYEVTPLVEFEQVD